MGWIPKWFKPCLSRQHEITKMIDISHRQLTDIPVEVFEEERTLEILNASSNRISELPRIFFNCDELRELDLSDNEIGFIPPAILSLSFLQKMDLSKNSLKTLPDNMKNCTNLMVLDVSLNPLEKFPECVTNLTSLTELYMNDIYLDFLPANFGRLINLKVLEIRDNNLSKLPKTMNRLINLMRLDIGNNDFDSLPDVVCNLNNLTELWIDCNYLQALPTGIGNLRKLHHFEASENELKTLPKEIGYWTRMVELSLSRNRLNNLPSSIGNLKNLQTLRLDNNKLQIVPVTLGKLTNLQELYLNKNYLESLPLQIGLLQNLEVMMLDYNELWDIPRDIGSCKNLRVLTLAYNNIMYIPSEVGRLSKLTCLNLSKNILQNLPVSLLGLTKLSCLWLSTLQSQPLIPLQQETSKQQLVLTCFMLPQASHKDKPCPEPPSPVHEHSLKERKLKFAPDPNWDNTKQAGKLTRTPTPFPKEARALERHARRMTRDMVEITSKPNTIKVQADVQRIPQKLLEIKEAIITTTPQNIKPELRTSNVNLTASGTEDIADITSQSTETQLYPNKLQENSTESLLTNKLKLMSSTEYSALKLRKLNNFVSHNLSKNENSNEPKDKILLELSNALEQYKTQNPGIFYNSPTDVDEISSNGISLDNHSKSNQEFYNPEVNTYENVKMSCDETSQTNVAVSESKEISLLDHQENKKDSLFFIYKSGTYDIKEAKSIKMNLDNASCDTVKTHSKDSQCACCDEYSEPEHSTSTLKDKRLKNHPKDKPETYLVDDLYKHMSVTSETIPFYKTAEYLDSDRAMAESLQNYHKSSYMADLSSFPKTLYEASTSYSSTTHSYPITDESSKCDMHTRSPSSVTSTEDIRQLKSVCAESLCKYEPPAYYSGQVKKPVEILEDDSVNIQRSQFIDTPTGKVPIRPVNTMARFNFPPATVKDKTKTKDNVSRPPLSLEESFAALGFLDVKYATQHDINTPFPSSVTTFPKKGAYHESSITPMKHVKEAEDIQEKSVCAESHYKYEPPIYCKAQVKSISAESHCKYEPPTYKAQVKSLCAESHCEYEPPTYCKAQVKSVCAESYEPPTYCKAQVKSICAESYDPPTHCKAQVMNPVEILDDSFIMRQSVNVKKSQFIKKSKSNASIRPANRMAAVKEKRKNDLVILNEPSNGDIQHTQEATNSVQGFSSVRNYDYDFIAHAQQTVLNAENFHKNPANTGFQMEMATDLFEPPPYHIVSASSKPNVTDEDMKPHYRFLTEKDQSYLEPNNISRPYCEGISEKMKSDHMYDNTDRPIIFFQDKPQPGQNIVVPTPQRPRFFGDGESVDHRSLPMSYSVKRYLDEAASHTVLDTDTYKPYLSAAHETPTTSLPQQKPPRTWKFGRHKNCIVVQITVRKNPSLGFTIHEKDDTHGIFVKSLLAGSHASEVLKVGDKILEVDGVDFLQISLRKANKMLLTRKRLISMTVSRMQ